MNEESRLEARARAAFDASVDRLDAATRSRLTQARHAALAELERPRIRALRYAPVGAAAVLVLAATMWMRPDGMVETAPAPALVAAEDLDLLAVGDDLDLLGDDLDFYAFAAMAEHGDGIG